MFVPWAALNQQHSDTNLCERGVERKHRQLAYNEAHEGTALDFKLYDHTMAVVSSFLYLGQTIPEVENN